MICWLWFIIQKTVIDWLCGTGYMNPALVWIEFQSGLISLHPDLAENNLDTTIHTSEPQYRKGTIMHLS